MRVRWCVLTLLLLGCVGCSTAPVISEGIVTPSAVPTSTVTETATPVPTATIVPTDTAAPTPTQTVTPTPTATPGPEAKYPRFVLINQDEQTMVVYENGKEIRRMPVSTGKPDQEETSTPAWEGEVGKFVGTFFAYGTWADEAWYLFEHYGSMLIHSAPYLKENGQKVYQELDALGVRPLSHGCIRLPPEEAAWFSSWQPQGAHVIILPLTRTL